MAPSRMLVGLGKSAQSHIVRLMHSRQKGPKRIKSVSRISFMQQDERKHREPDVPEESPGGRMALQGLPQKNLHQLILWKMAPLQNACSTRPRAVAELVKSALTQHRQVDEQPSKRSRKNYDKSAVAILKKGDWQERGYVFLTNVTIDRGNLVRRVINSWDKIHLNAKHLMHGKLGCVFQDMTLPKSILQKCRDMPKRIQRVKFTKAIARHTKIRDQNPSFGKICSGEPHERSSNPPKFEDRSQEETEWQEQGAREAAWKLANRVLKLKEHQRATFFSPSENRCLPASTLKPEEERICCRLRSANAHDQQKGLEWCWNGYFDEIVQSYDGHNRQWRSANAWRGNCVCQRIGYILDYESPR